MRRLLVLACAAVGVAACGPGIARAAEPGAPTNVVATAGDGRAAVTWTAPASDGGSPITSYVVVASGGSNQTCTAQPARLKCTVTKLINGTSYTFTVTAQNAGNSGPSSAPSNAVTPGVPPVPPTNVTATAGDQEATVNCAAPNGSTITSYTATASPSGKHATAPTCPITVTGLTDGKSYTFTVTAAAGDIESARSAPSAAVTPVDTHPPTRPAGIRGRIKNGSLVLSWDASMDNVRVAGYAVYVNGKALVNVRRGTTTTLHLGRHGSSIYTVKAFDAAGNQSPPSSALTARPTPYPKNAPRNLPRWASKLLAWQERGGKGARPKTPARLPAWYAAWKHWRLTPYEVVS